MPSRIEDYALIGDGQTSALVARDGSMDWLCLPRFDSDACFAALLGTPEHGRWLLHPRDPVRQVRRRYQEGTLVLETEYRTDAGRVAVIDFMPKRAHLPDVVRIVEGRQGRVPMRLELTIRFDYGSSVPWVRRMPGGLRATVGPNTLYLRTDVPLRGEDLRTVARFDVGQGQRVPFLLTWAPTYALEPAPVDPLESLDDTASWWRAWSSRCAYRGPWKEAVLRSLITLKALVYAPTGGLVAAATTSLPEQSGGARNWDYRYCWLRDATFTLYALLAGGYTEEAEAGRTWLVNAVAGTPAQMQILYGVAGERRIREYEVDWLPGYEGAAPVRVGNAAHRQFQLDIYGEIMDGLQLARHHGLHPDENAWRVQRALMEFLETAWRDPDEGIWEIRGPRRHFTHSKVMAWVALDRAIQTVKRFGLPGDLEKWRRLRRQIHDDVCRHGFDERLHSFVQSYGSTELDASLLMLPLVGFLPADDPRVSGTVAAIQRNLMRDGFVMRYRSESGIDGLPAGEGAFLPCTFWLADNLALQGHRRQAREVFERLLAVRNDVGLLSEEYDAAGRRLMGNMPQAFSHVGLINTARNLAEAGGPAEHRGRRDLPRDDPAVR